MSAWTCNRCGAENPSARTTCYECDASQSSISEAKAATDPTNSSAPGPLAALGRYGLGIGIAMFVIAAGMYIVVPRPPEPSEPRYRNFGGGVVLRDDLSSALTDMGRREDHASKVRQQRATAGRLAMWATGVVLLGVGLLFAAKNSTKVSTNSSVVSAESSADSSGAHRETASHAGSTEVTANVDTDALANLRCLRDEGVLTAEEYRERARLIVGVARSALPRETKINSCPGCGIAVEEERVDCQKCGLHLRDLAAEPA